MPHPKKRHPKTSDASRAAERNRVERQRQQEIDDEIQRLMAFLPPYPGPGNRKLSRNQILTELVEMCEKMRAEGKLLTADEEAAAPAPKAGSSSASSSN